MTEKEKTIKDEELEEVSGGKGYWEGYGIKYSSEEGDWHEGDQFQCDYSGGACLIRLILTNNGVFTDWYNGHKYNAEKYDWFTNEYKGETTVTDREIANGTWGLTPVKK